MDPEVRTYMNRTTQEFILEELSGVQPRDHSAKRAEGPSALFRFSARRQGLTITNTLGKHHTVKRGDKVVGGFEMNLTSLTSHEALRASYSIPLSKRYFHLMSVPTPVAQSYSAEEYPRALDDFRRIDRPATVKPATGRHGDGITRAVRNEQDFRVAWEQAVQYRHDPPLADPTIVVEEHLDGLDIRAYVVGEQVVSAVARLPLFCIGDGTSTLRELATAVERSRLSNPLLGRFEVDFERYLSRTFESPDATSDSGVVYQLSPNVHMEQGGVTVDVTDQLGEELADLAINAAWSIPGNHSCSVDLNTPSIHSAEGAFVLHIDAKSSFTVHHYPWMGRGRQVAGAILRTMASVSGERT